MLSIKIKKYLFIVFDLICAKIQLLSYPTNTNWV